MKRAVAFCGLVLVISLLAAGHLHARPVGEYEAVMVVTGWLKTDPQPLNARMGRNPSGVETFTDELGRPLYYVVSFHPSGFAIVPSNDRIEPILGFTSEGIYDPSPAGPLAALVANDARRRLITATVLDSSAALDAGVDTLAIASTALQETDVQKKWRRYIEIADTPAGQLSVAGLTAEDLDDLRVAPLIKTRWDQQTCYARRQDIDGKTYMEDTGVACYNYYTPPGEPGDPNNYPAGCVATAMAQVLCYHQWPQEGIGRNRFDIVVKDGNEAVSQEVWTRGGDGLGGPYDWARMTLNPDGSNPMQCQAIGGLCYDAGISVGMEYSAEGSVTATGYASEALTGTFRYSNAVAGANFQNGEEVNLGSALTRMINPNLDARKPVILGVTGEEGGHAVVCDGYGFKGSIVYYHLNMGSSALSLCSTLWYQLIPPHIQDMYKMSWCEEDPGGQSKTCYESSTEWDFDTVLACVYNIFAEETGEIISGRVLDRQGRPVSGIEVLAQSTTDPADTYEAQTDPNGVFAFVGCPSATEYLVKVNAPDVDYPEITVRTETSEDIGRGVGNVWNVVLKDTTALYVPDDCPTIQAAVDVAGNEQVIIVRPGTYTGPGNRDIDFKGKAITLMSENGPQTCILDCQGSESSLHRGFSFHSRETSTSVLDGLTIINGYHQNGGAVSCDAGNPTIRNCIFRNNVAGTRGGALYMDDCAPAITCCIFQSNSAGDAAKQSGEGGAIYNAGSSPTMSNCVFIGNQAGNTGSACGNGTTRECSNIPGCVPICLKEICYYDPIYHCVCVQRVNCQTCHDKASKPTLNNCTLVGNTSTLGTACAFDSGSVTVRNCVLWGNTPAQISAGPSAVVTYSAVEGGFVGEGNTSDDPLFVDPTGADYHLQAASPCVNAGDPNTTVASMETDLDGDPRVVGERIDMGAYEFQEQ